MTDLTEKTLATERKYTGKIISGDLVGREFRHFKGNLYRLEGFAKDSETLEEMVVYPALYGEHGLWVRPAKMFFDMDSGRIELRYWKFEPILLFLIPFMSVWSGCAIVRKAEANAR